jgi:hypothetical protein
VTTADPLVLSLGLGVDSIGVLIGWRQLGIRPDAIVFSDPGSEHPETYAIRPVVDAWLESVGFPQIDEVRYRARGARQRP